MRYARAAAHVSEQDARAQRPAITSGRHSVAKNRPGSTHIAA
jgi:hypothetical protein